MRDVGRQLKWSFGSDVETVTGTEKHFRMSSLIICGFHRIIICYLELELECAGILEVLPKAVAYTTLRLSSER